MAQAVLSIDLDAIVANWRALARRAGAGAQTGAVLKADAYGLGAARVARSVAEAGARVFFVATCEEGVALRRTLGEGAQIFIFSGHMEGDTASILEADLVPLLNSASQAARHFERAAQAPFGVQLDSGMRRLGMEEAEWHKSAPRLLEAGPALIMSHLACADDRAHPMNAAQLERFTALTQGCAVPRSLAATGGILLGPRYHFDLTRPGIGLYGGLPFQEAARAVRLSLPVIQTRAVRKGEPVGYGCAWVAPKDTLIATVAGGYADGLLRALSAGGAMLWDEGRPCPLVGRVSMDLITVDVGHLPALPRQLDILGPEQGVDDLAALAGTIGYEFLTALGARYTRRYLSAGLSAGAPA